MSTLQVGQAFMTFRSRMVLLPTDPCRTGSAAALACKDCQLVYALQWLLLAFSIGVHHSSYT